MNNSAFSNEYCHDYMSLYYGGQTETVSHQQNQPAERDESPVIKEKKEERIAPESIRSSSSSTNDYTSSGIAKRPLPNNNNATKERREGSRNRNTYIERERATERERERENQ